MLTRGRLGQLAAEFLGAGLLVMIALVLSETTSVSYFVATSLAITLIAAYTIFAPVSGAHLNPAVTFGLWTARRIRTIPGLAYIAAQVLGGLGALLLYQYFTDHSIASKAATFSWPMFVAEVVGAFVLVLGFTAAVSRTVDVLHSALTYGASLFVGVMVAATATAAYINPAIALGQNNGSWLYILGPLVGGLLAVNLYDLLFTSKKIWWINYLRTKR
ncbi:MAG: aquaporin [Candidatus Saccharimonadales bacterium]